VKAASALRPLSMARCRAATAVPTLWRQKVRGEKLRPGLRLARACTAAAEMTRERTARKPSTTMASWIEPTMPGMP